MSMCGHELFYESFCCFKSSLWLCSTWLTFEEWQKRRHKSRLACFQYDTIVVILVIDAQFLPIVPSSLRASVVRQQKNTDTTPGVVMTVNSAQTESTLLFHNCSLTKLDLKLKQIQIFGPFHWAVTKYVGSKYSAFKFNMFLNEMCVISRIICIHNLYPIIKLLIIKLKKRDIYCTNRKLISKSQDCFFCSQC